MHATHLLLFPISFPYRRITNTTRWRRWRWRRRLQHQLLKADTPRLDDAGYYLLVWPKDRLVTPLDYSVTTLCYTLSDTINDWLSNMHPRRQYYHSLLAIMISNIPRQGPPHTIPHNSATMASILQDSKVLFPSPQGCTALILFTSLSTYTVYSGPPRFSQGKTILKLLCFAEYIIKLLLPFSQCLSLGSFYSICCLFD